MARMTVLFARDEPTAVILRRGPSNWYHLIQWNTSDDVFTHGAWFHGRIYEDKCDLSPDGTLLVYFAHRGKGARRDPGISHVWTAISRPPWMYALALWPEDSTYSGGGTFLDNRRLEGPRGEPHPDHRFDPRRLQLYPRGKLTQEPVSIPDVPGADWTGVDQRGQVVYSQASRLFRIPQASRGKKKQTVPAAVLLADFSDLTPDPQPTPEWARRPL